MHLTRLSPRLVLAISIIIIAIVIAYRSWSKDLMANKMLVAAALFLIGLYLLWLEWGLACDDRKDDRDHKKKRDGDKDGHHEVLAAAE